MGGDSIAQPVARKHAFSFNQGASSSHNVSPVLVSVDFCMSTALTCIYVKIAIKINEQPSENSLKKLQLYLVGKAKIFLN
jgi:hypothetical protein